VKKNVLFSLEERISMIKEACSICGMESVEVRSTDKLTAEFAAENDALCIIRGLRTLSDFDYEFQMALANKILNKNIETVFLMTDEKYTMVTSSLVKEIASYGGDLRYFVPENVIKELNKKMNRRMI
jgi:pantetheine-phosphate adenylyltransferase